jgi:hypothetical protein
MAWSEDGMTGYLAFIGNDGSLNIPGADTTYYLIIYKSADGGVTWTKISPTPNINLLASKLTSVTPLTAAFECRAGLDKNNELHVNVGIGEARAGFSIASAFGFWALFDIYSTGGGTSWWGQKLANPMTFRGAFTNAGQAVDADSRPYVSRSYDGSKMIFSWFDTDTSLFAGTGNSNPDMWLIGYDVTANKWTAPMNATATTNAEGVSLFGTTAYYTIAGSSNETVPMVYSEMPGFIR